MSARKGARPNYGAVAKAVRGVLAACGVVEARMIRLEGTSSSAAAAALDEEVKAGRAERVFRGVYATPEVAARIRRACDMKGAET